MISIDSKVSYLVVDVFMVIGLETVNLFGVRNGGTSTEMSIVLWILSVNVDFCLI